MKTHYALSTLIVPALLAGCATTSTPSEPPPEGALSGYELVQLMSGARLYGPSNTTPEATFEQVYPEIGWRQMKGTATGTWNPPGEASSEYPVKWRVKGHQWCEDWGSGSDCYTILPLEDNRYDFVKANGERITAEWRIDSPMTGPLRLTGEQITTGERNMKYTGNWQYTGSGGNQSGTFESHYCADGTRIASSDGGEFESTAWHVENDMQCYMHAEGGKRCFEVWQMADGSQYTYRKAKSGTVTGQTISVEPSDRCSA